MLFKRLPDFPIPKGGKKIEIINSGERIIPSVIIANSECVIVLCPYVRSKYFDSGGNNRPKRADGWSISGSRENIDVMSAIL